MSKSLSRISPPPSFERSMTAVPSSFVMVRSLNPVMSLNAERSLRSPRP